MKLKQDTEWMLVVDDQADVWMMLQAHLRRTMPHVQTVHASNGPTALSYLQTCLVEHQLLPRLVLTDLYMPARTDGLHLLTALKDSASPYSHLSILLMSSSTDSADYQEIDQRGVPYLLKPLSISDWEEFLASIQWYWNQSIPSQYVGNQ
jgi:CheY-like chemotaxis protein